MTSFQQPSISPLQQRTIEARVLGPLIQAYQEEIGAERANAVARRVITRLALESGRSFAERLARNDMEALAEVIGIFKGKDDLEIEVLEKTPERYSFNVRRCRFAEMYRELGLEKLGSILSCGRDYNLGRGMNPRIKLERTQTIMQGAPYCDFRFTLEPKDQTGR